MKTIKIQLFPSKGAVNQQLNKFAEFVFNRKTEMPILCKFHVKKLSALSGSTNTAMSLLQGRIDNSEIDYNQIPSSKQIIKEMKDIIRKYSVKN